MIFHCLDFLRYNYSGPGLYLVFHLFAQAQGPLAQAAIIESNSLR